jgi:glycosyltransferase 2 family protein
LLWHLLVVAIVAIAGWYFIDITEVWNTLRGVEWRWLILLLLLATIDRFLMAAKWWQLLQHVTSTVQFTTVLSAYYQAAFVQRFIPSSLGGDALRALIVSTGSGNTSGVIASIVVEKLVAMLAAVFLAICGGVLIVSQVHGQAMDLVLLSIPGMLALILLLLRASLHRPLVLNCIGWLPGLRVRATLSKVYGEYAGFQDAPRALIANFIYCIVEQAVQILLLFYCAQALGVDADALTILTAISLAQCLRKFAILLEGWLLGEFTAVLVYSVLGIPEAQALAFSLLGHAMGIVAAIPGALLFMKSSFELGDLRRQKKSAAPRPD